MSGQLVGQAIGYYFGGPWGAMIGGMIGGALFPSKTDGPKLGDIKPQASEYGRPLPLIYGTIALGGNVIWASEFTIVEGEGGKGGEEPTGDTAFANFAIAICEADGDVRLGRIYAGPEKRLIWDGGVLEGADSGALLRFYDGADDQLPDALIESFEGVGNVPGYRGTAYVVFENFPLVKDGNRLPFLTIEVGPDTATATANLGEVWIQQVLVTDLYYITFYFGSTRGFIVRLLSDKTTLVYHYQYEAITEWSSSDYFFYDEDRNTLVRQNGTMAFDTIAIATGAIVNHAVSATGGPADPSTGLLRKGAIYHQGSYIFFASGSGSTRTTAYLMDPDTLAPVATYTYDMNAEFTGPVFAPVGGGAYVFGCTTTGIRKYPLSVAASTDAGPIAPYTAVVAAAQDPVTGYIWSAEEDGALTTTAQFVQVTDPETATDLYADTIAIDSPYYFGWGENTEATPWVFYSVGPDRYALMLGRAGFGLVVAGDYTLGFNATLPAFVSQQLGTGSIGTSFIQAAVWNPTAGVLAAFRKLGWLEEIAPVYPPVFPFHSFYLGGADASVNPQGQLLSEIVADLSERAGLTAGQIDVTALTDMVDGYAIANQSTVRDAIMALMPAYYFDAVESDGKVKFVKRGGAIAVVIPDDDVGAFESGSEPPDQLETTRRKENELPRTVNVRYILEATDYAQAAKAAKRLVGASGEEETLDMPLVLTDTKAQEIAEVVLHGAWVARLTYSFTLPRKYGYLEPTDIIVVYGYTMRLTKTINADGIIKCEATHDDSNIYVPDVVVTETPPSDGSVGTISETVLELA